MPCTHCLSELEQHVCITTPLAFRFGARVNIWEQPLAAQLQQIIRFSVSSIFPPLDSHIDVISATLHLSLQITCLYLSKMSRT